ncbi:outer membrane protein assembly factor BamD [Gemmatimonadota bacterium]
MNRSGRTMRRLFGIPHLLLFGVILLAAACSHIPRPQPGAAPEDYLRYGWQLLDEGKFFQAKEIFQELIYTAPGSAIIDSVHYGLAETHFAERNYFLALSEYSTIVRSFPRSGLVDDAAFKVGICHWEQSNSYKLDQMETLEAREAFRTFLLDYPTSDIADDVVTYLEMTEDKLARKKIYEGETYLKLGTERDLVSAVIAFQEALTIWQRSSHIDLALWGLGEVYYRQGRHDDARAAFGALVANFPDSKRVKRARARLEDLGASETLSATPPPIS